MSEFIKHAEKPNTSSAKKEFEEALWKDFEYGSRPSEFYCNELLSVTWDWDNTL